MTRVPLDEGMSPQQSEAPNPELLRKDPMAELFGPGSGVKLYGNPEDEIPDEIRALLDANGLGGKAFSCMLKEIPSNAGVDGESSNVSSVFVKGFTRGIPSPDYIAREYGPGNYLLQFSWQIKEGDGTRRMQREEVPLVISEKVLGEFKNQRIKNKIRDAMKHGEEVREALVEKSIEGELIGALTGRKNGGDDAKPADVAKAYLAEALETAKLLGLTPANNMPAPRPFEWDKILPAVMTGLTAFLTLNQQAEAARREESYRMLMLLMSSSQNSNNQLLEMMKSQSGQGSGNMAIREFKDMILGALDIKEVLSGNSKESLGDKIFRLIESVAPSIMSIAAVSAQQAAKNPMVQMAKGYVESNPDFQALKRDPAEEKKVIDSMDQTYGWRQTDHILQTMGWERPATCPRLPDQKEPPQEDISDGETTEIPQG